MRSGLMRRRGQWVRAERRREVWLWLTSRSRVGALGLHLRCIYKIPATAAEISHTRQQMSSVCRFTSISLVHCEQHLLSSLLFLFYLTGSLKKSITISTWYVYHSFKSHSVKKNKKEVKNIGLKLKSSKSFWHRRQNSQGRVVDVKKQNRSK